MPTRSQLSRSVSARALVLPALITAGAFFGASPAAAQDACSILPLGIIDCGAPVPPPAGSPPGTPPTGGSVDLVGSVDPLTATLADGFTSNGPFNLGTLAGADVNLISQGLSTIESVGPGLVVDSGRSLNAQITNVSTVGDGATAVVLNAVDDVIFTSDGLISTTGLGATGLDIEAASATLDLGTVTTVGDDALGLDLVALDGPATVTLDLIETEGEGSTGTAILAGDAVSLSGGAIRTGGTDAVAFSISNDTAACVLLGAGGCSNTVALEEVTTNGFGGIGGLVSAAGPTDIDIGVLRTEGDEAAGLDLSADPSACVTLGVGACGTAFTVGELLTAGDRSPGAIVRAAAPIVADVGVLRTEGDEAAGLDLATDPAACAVLGAGACDSSFSVGELTTGGAGATGILARITGDTTGNVGVLRTEGDDAAGIDIASDPTACAIIGAGACDVDLAANEVSTEGNGAAAVLINTAGDVLTDLGLLTTEGDDSTGLTIIQDPTACLALGPGSCGVMAEVDEVDTGGDNSGGIDIDTPGEVDVDAGEVDTDGDDSDGVEVDGGDGPIDVDVGQVDTGGDGSDGVDVSGNGPISVDAGTVNTGGDDSDGIEVDGGAGPVVVVAETVTTTGDESDGVDVATTTGPITIDVGDVSVGGLGSEAIVASSSDCGEIDITVRRSAISAQGSAVVADTACSLSVTTLTGSSVRGALAGIDVSSGTGADIEVGGTLTGTGGPALQVDGAAADVTIATTGLVDGRIDLTDSDDVLRNNGVLRRLGTSSFGGGNDLLVNAGTIEADGAVSLTGLESLSNSGIIDLADGATGDQLTLSGAYVGANGRLLVDLDAGAAGTPADRLVIGGAASGATSVELNLLGGGAAIANPAGTVVVDAASASSGSFFLAGTTRAGLIDYSLGTNGTGDVLVFALPNQYAVQPLLAAGLGQEFWYQSADAWSATGALRRDTLAAGGATGFWAQAYGSEDDRGDDRDFDVFGTSVTEDFGRKTTRYGGQLGFDFGGGSTAFGVTGGWGTANTNLVGGSEFDLSGFNVGAYVLSQSEAGLYFEGLAKVDFFEGEIENGTLFTGADIDGRSYGVEGEVGYRVALAGGDLDLGGGLAYVRTELDDFDVSGGGYEFDAAESLRGRLGVRYTHRWEGSAGFADLKLLHEFMGENEASFTSGGFTLPLVDEPHGTWVRGEVGLVGSDTARLSPFVSLWGDVGDVEGVGARVGLRF